MTRDQQLLASLKSLVADLTPDQAEAVEELSDYFRRVVKHAGEPVGALALAITMAEIQAQ